jgi:hypothetical protein
MISPDLYDVAGRDPSMEVPPAVLAGPFDPLLHGWVSNAEILAGRTGIVTNNGLFRPFVLIDGRAAAIWGLAGNRVKVRPLQRLSSSHRRCIESEARKVLTYLGMPVTPVSFDP